MLAASKMKSKGWRRITRATVFRIYYPILCRQTARPVIRLQRTRHPYTVRERIYPVSQRLLARAGTVLLDFARDIAREASGFLAAIREKKNLSSSIRKLATFYFHRRLGIELCLDEVCKRSLALGRMVHDAGTVVAERIAATNRARRKPSRTSPLGACARKINLAKVRRVGGPLIEQTPASDIEPGGGALVGLVPVRLSID
jgi:hypothetical protein